MAQFFTDSSNRVILVLAAAPGRLQEFDRFLGRREWVIRLHNDLRGFLDDLIKLKPRLVLMSVDFHHPNLEQIRRTIVQTYQTHVIDFAEEQTLDSWERLKNIDHPHKIYGYLTGPALERAMQRLIPSEMLRPQDENSVHSRERLLQEGVSRLMKASFDEGDGQIRRPLSWTMNMTCIQVKTPVLCGHFVVATGTDRVLEDDLMILVKDALVSLMRDVGYEVEAADVFPVELRRVEFKKWAEKTARFMENGVHRGVEVALAFFPSDAGLFSFEPSSDPKYVRLSLDEIRPDQRVDYEIYLHLPLNGKYILYVSHGGELSFQQQLGLEARGIKHLHVRDEDRLGVLRDRAARRLDRLISDFYETKTSF